MFNVVDRLGIPKDFGGYTKIVSSLENSTRLIVNVGGKNDFTKVTMLHAKIATVVEDHFLSFQRGVILNALLFTMEAH